LGSSDVNPNQSAESNGIVKTAAENIGHCSATPGQKIHCPNGEVTTSRPPTIESPAHRIEEGQDAANVIQMQVRDKQLIQFGGMHSQAVEVPVGASAYVEDKGLTVP
jgi:hypothetical protein